jgi:hypothetical protein
VESRPGELARGSTDPRTVTINLDLLRYSDEPKKRTVVVVVLAVPLLEAGANLEGTPIDSSRKCHDERKGNERCAHGHSAGGVAERTPLIKVGGVS